MSARDDRTPHVEPPPLVPDTHRGAPGGIVGACLAVALRASLLVSPRPAVAVVRHAFALGGARVARGLEAHTPTDVAALVDEAYGDGPDEVFDVFRPDSVQGPLPAVVWLHGGGWIGGSKEELAGYLKLVASKGYAVVGVRYSLAPGERYPTPLRQAMQALAHLQANGARLGVDPDRIVLAGDSAGAQLAAQVAALVTTPGYAEAVGVAPTIARGQLRGVVLACGPYDLALLASGRRTAAGRRFVRAVLWTYSGKRRFLDDPGFATFSVAGHVTGAFPPALVTVGDADPLRPHSELLVDTLRAQGAQPDTVFFPAGHEPPLGHQYQFDLDTDAGRLFLERLLAFLRLHLEPGDLGSEAAADPAERA